MTLAPWAIPIAAALLVLLLGGTWCVGWVRGLKAGRRWHDEAPELDMFERAEAQRKAAAQAAARARVDADRPTPGDVTIEGEDDAPDAYAPGPALDDAAAAQMVVLLDGGLRLQLVDGEGRVLKSYEWDAARAWRLWRAYARVRRRPMGAAAKEGDAS